MSILAINDLKKSYGNTEVLSGITFEIKKPSSIAIIGSNGAGKSTLLRCCTRLIEPTSGHVRIFGTDILNSSHRVLRRVRTNIGFVFQKHNLVPRLSVLSNVVHGNIGRLAMSSWLPFGGFQCWYQSLAPHKIRLRAMSCLEKVGLATLAEKRADTLSGGQSQRVAIARSLMQHPKLLFADEPVASLDPVAGQEVMNLFKALCLEENITLVFTSHHVSHALDFSDRVLALKKGHISLWENSANLKPEDLVGEYE